MRAYSGVEVRRCLNAIAQGLPKAVGVTNDTVLNTTTGHTFQASTLYLRNGRHLRVDTSRRKDDPSRITRRLQEQAGLAEAQVDRVATALGTLTDINSRGGWGIRVEAPKAQRILCSFDAEGAYDAADYPLYLADRLAEFLPSVATIHIDACGVEASGGGRLRERHWLRFNDQSNQEMAALDAVMFGVHARDAFNPETTEYSQLNSKRMHVWAEQLKIDLSATEDRGVDHVMGELLCTLQTAITLGFDVIKLQDIAG